jgi:hypothetical protein
MPKRKGRNGSHRGHGRMLAAATLVCWGYGCSHEASAWKRVTSDHFRLYTDLGSRSYNDVLERLEDVETALSSTFFRGAQVPATDVFLFGDGEFEELVGLSPRGGSYLPGMGAGGKGALLINEGWNARYIDLVAAHELAHSFIHTTLPRVPVWFDEGLARLCWLREDALEYQAAG